MLPETPWPTLRRLDAASVLPLDYARETSLSLHPSTEGRFVALGTPEQRLEPSRSTCTEPWKTARRSIALGKPRRSPKPHLKSLTIRTYNIIVVSMIPALTQLPGSPWDVLPPGIHPATLTEIESAFAYNPRRRELFAGLVAAACHLANVGCQGVFLDGSYVSAKPLPGDFDACWAPEGVDFNKLDPVFDDFDNGRANQKARFGGEFFPSTMIALDIGAAFTEFFQIDRFTGKKKGILSIAIATDVTVTRRIRP